MPGNDCAFRLVHLPSSEGAEQQQPVSKEHEKRHNLKWLPSPSVRNGDDVRCQHTGNYCHNNHQQHAIGNLHHLSSLAEN
jgi:hypothetical protein